MEQSVHYENQHQHTPSIHHNVNQYTLLCMPSWINNTVAMSVFSFGSNCMFIVLSLLCASGMTLSSTMIQTMGHGQLPMTFPLQLMGFTFRSHKWIHTTYMHVRTLQWMCVWVCVCVCECVCGCVCVRLGVGGACVHVYITCAICAKMIGFCICWVSCSIQVSGINATGGWRGEGGGGCTVV